MISSCLDGEYIADTAALSAFVAREGMAKLEGDFCWSLDFSRAFYLALVREGFLSIALDLAQGEGLVYPLAPATSTDRTP